MESQEERLKSRLAELKNCKTPEEMSFAIWSKGLEKAMQSSRQSYRDSFVDWVECYRLKNQKAKWKYKSPKELADSIWKPFLDDANDTWFPSLRTALIEWIEQYSNT